MGKLVREQAPVVIGCLFAHSAADNNVVTYGERLRPEVSRPWDATDVLMDSNIPEVASKPLLHSSPYLGMHRSAARYCAGSGRRTEPLGVYAGLPLLTALFTFAG
jgi:hypothetical protein